MEPAEDGVSASAVCFNGQASPGGDLSPKTRGSVKSYEDQVQEQIEQFRHTEDMHELPPVFHVWSSDYAQPGMNSVFGTRDINSLYVEAFVASAAHSLGMPVFLSLGCGDGAVEIGIAKSLLERGVEQFRFVCCDLSDILLARFGERIPAELTGHFDLRVGDLNASTFDSKFDAVMANHSLHHIVDLECVFGSVYDNLTDGGIFVTCDMIGRNGHMRWPEARLFVEFFWPLMSHKQRYNSLLRRWERRFADHDCSSAGFEGIRSQDVLPLILKQGFHPWKFLGFGGVIDVFVDRCFGPNFDMDNLDHVFLARRIGFLNEILLDAGLVKPTMMLAYFTKHSRDQVYYRNRSAQSAIRDTTSDPPWLPAALADFARIPVDPNFVFRSRSAETVEADARISEALAALRHAQAESAAAQARVSETLAALRHAQVESAAAQATVIQQAHLLRAMENSSSWQLTSPLRLIMRLIRR